MKNIFIEKIVFKVSVFLVYILFYLFGKSITAQQYQPFPDNNVIWKIEKVFYSPPCYVYHSYLLHLYGDTIINSVSYKKLFQKTTHLTCTFVNYPWGYYGAVRQDTLNKKIYYYSNVSTSEELLYDFDLQINDTLPFSIINPGPTPQIIDQIDSIQLLDGSYRRTYHITPGSCTANLIIEGIGASWGLLEPYECGIGEYTETRCYYVDSLLLLGSCQHINSDNEIQFNPDWISIFPNPFEKFVKVESSETLNKIKVYSSNMTLLTEFNCTENSVLLSLDGLPKGLLVVELISDRNILIRKIIRQ